MVGVEGIEPPMPTSDGRVRPAALPTEHHTHNMEETARVGRAIPEGMSRFKRGRLATCRTSPNLAVAA